MVDQLNKVLILRHERPTGYSCGGVVYTDALLEMLRRFNPGVVIDQCYARPMRSARLRTLAKAASILRSAIHPLPAKPLHFYSRAFAHEVERSASRGTYDLVIINGIDVLWCRDLIPPRVRVLYIAHNIEYTLYRHQIAKHLSIPLLGRLLVDDANKLKRFELGHARRCSGIVTVSTLDQGFFSERFPCLPSITISPSYAYPVSRSRPAIAVPPLRLAFLGYLQWWPNRRDLKWFLDNVLPHVPDHIHLHVYGKGSEDLGAGPRLVGHGYVADTREVWQHNHIVIQPVLEGESGVSTKTTEAMYNRMPQLVTRGALRGIPIQADPAIVTADGADAWIAFLNGDGPRRLAVERGSGQNAKRVSIAANAQRLDGFLRSLRDADQGTT